MTVKTLIECLSHYDDNVDVEVEMRETETGKHIDTTAAILFSENDFHIPTLVVDVEKGKLLS